MAEFIIGTIIGGAGLCMAIKGAVDSFLWIESVLVQNEREPGVIDRIHALEGLKKKLKEWRDDFAVKETQKRG